LQIAAILVCLGIALAEVFALAGWCLPFVDGFVISLA
jgi:hypothetical protein